MQIGALARMTGCRVVTIRYYEKEGLLGAPERTDSNYRQYGDKDVERLKFILHCRRHGMKLSEIRDLLSYRDHPKSDCAWISNLIATHITNVEEQIASLQHLKWHLEELRKQCSGGNSGEGCGILKKLGDAEECRCCRAPACGGKQPARA